MPDRFLVTINHVLEHGLYSAENFEFLKKNKGERMWVFEKSKSYFIGPVDLNFYGNPFSLQLVHKKDCTISKPQIYRIRR